jgi:hypothetical protein
MNGEQLRELQDRSRFFSERFPGVAIADRWKRERDRQADRPGTHRDHGPEHDREERSPRSDSPDGGA